MSVETMTEWFAEGAAPLKEVIAAYTVALFRSRCDQATTGDSLQTPRVFLTEDRIHVQMWFPSASLSVSGNMM